MLKKHLILGIAVFLSSLSPAFAVDLKGRIGFGAGWTLPAVLEEYDGWYKIGLLTPTVITTRIGVAPRIAIEPTFQITSVSNDPVRGSTFTLRGLFGYVLLEHEKTNITAKAGISFANVSERGRTVLSEFGIPFGIGLEHWVSEHFSVDLTTISGFFSQTKPSKKTTFTLGNATLNLCLIWYY